MAFNGKQRNNLGVQEAIDDLGFWWPIIPVNGTSDIDRISTSFMDDFIAFRIESSGDVVLSDHGWFVLRNAGTGSSIVAKQAEIGHNGIISTGLGTATGARYSMLHNKQPPGLLPFIMKNQVNIDVLFRISTFDVATQTRIGLTVETNPTLFGTASDTDGIFLHYNPGTTFFEVISKNATATTTAVSSITLVANTWYKFELRYNEVDNTGAWRITDGTLNSTGTITTNLPHGKKVAMINGIYRLASGVNATLDIDYTKATFMYRTTSDTGARL